MERGAGKTKEIQGPNTNAERKAASKKPQNGFLGPEKGGGGGLFFQVGGRNTRGWVGGFG